MQYTLTLATSQALADYVTNAHRPTPGHETKLWVSLAYNRFGYPLSKQVISNICLKHLGTSKVHATRHTLARAVVEVGARRSDIQARLGHANLQTTSTCLVAIRSAESPNGEALARLLGLDG